jgi:two-component system NtrC family sensor kinase
MAAGQVDAAACSVTMKSRRRKITKVKRRKELAAARRRGARDDNLKRALVECRQELKEALEQQTATSEVLRVISHSPTDVQPVFAAIAASATRLCDAVNSLVIRFDGRLMHLVAHHNVIPERLDALERLFPYAPSRASVVGRSILSRVAVQVADITRDREYMLPTATTVGYRTALAVPMLHDEVLIGAIVVARDRVAPFSEKHIALLQIFADQAVIAIENVRLFESEQQRTRQLTESLAQQTTTADVLKVISRSTFDLQVVLDTLTESAARLCEADMAAITRQKPFFWPTRISSWNQILLAACSQTRDYTRDRNRDCRPSSSS